MSRKTSISIDDNLAEFIDQKIEHDGYETTSAVVRVALRMLMQHETSIDALKDEIVKADASGPVVEFCVEDFLERMNR